MTLTNDDRPTVATIPVKLIDPAPFDGQATASSIVIAPGNAGVTPPLTISY
ncbi:hypothetical protein D3C86_1820020 [compost metagenome]